METRDVLRVLKLYRETFEALGIEPRSYQHDKVPEGRKRQLEHCHGMLEEMETFLAEGRLEKVFRWLGFVQGVLWANKIFTLDELKKHNRPDGS